MSPFIRSHRAFALLGLIASAVALGASVPAAAADDCSAAQLSNGGFETPVMSTLVQDDIFYDSSGAWYVWPGNGNGGWAVVASLPATDTPMSQSLVWQATEGGVELQDISPFAGDQYAEITGLEVTNTLYQSIPTTPGQVMNWSLAHRSASGTDVMEVQIGADVASLISQEVTPDTGVGVVGQPTYISDETTWRVWRGTYVVPDGQFETVFGFNGISSGGGDPTVGNLIDSIEFSCDASAAETTTDPVDPSLASTGLSVAALLAGVAMAIGMFVLAVSSFGARGRLHEMAVDNQLATTLRALDARLRRIEKRNNRR